jgi:L-rhamnose mutarotase
MDKRRSFTQNYSIFLEDGELVLLRYLNRKIDLAEEKLLGIRKSL